MLPENRQLRLGVFFVGILADAVARMDEPYPAFFPIRDKHACNPLALKSALEYLPFANTAALK